MFRPLPLYIALRQTVTKRGNGFVSFISLFSFLGMSLGVAALCVVMSVMNGFEEELFQRILSAVPHGHIDAADKRMQNWRPLAASVEQQPGIVFAEPYISSEALLSADGQLAGAVLQAVLPPENDSHGAYSQMLSTRLARLQAGKYGLILGQLLQRRLGVKPGDKVTVLLPQIDMTLFGAFPRSRRFTVLDSFSAGMQMDASLAFIHLHDGQRLMRLGDATHGLRVQVSDRDQAAQLIADAVAAQGADSGLIGRDWGKTHVSLFSAVRMEKILMGLLLMIVIAVAAFNIVAMLAITVEQKREAIALLGVLGMRPAQIMAIFVCQGAALGIAGILFGLVFGSLLAFNIKEIVAALEAWFGVVMFDPKVYFISGMPSKPIWADFALVSGAALALSVIATLYPSWQASRVSPAVAIRYV